MNKFIALTAVATAALTATPALAQAPQGPRVEALVGYDAPRVRVNEGGIVGTFAGESDYLYKGDIIAGNPKVFAQMVAHLSRFSRK